MKKVLVMLVIVMFSCKAEPEALRYGTDGCHTCKMTLMDHKFGAELVTEKGKVYKFDDINCLAGFINSGYLNDEIIRHTLVVEYTQPGKLIPAEAAFFLKSDNIHSPMGSGVAALETQESLQKLQAELNGKQMVWEEVSMDYNK